MKRYGRMRTVLLLLLIRLWASGPVPAAWAQQPQHEKYKSPTCVAFSPDGTRAYVTNHTANSLSVIDTAARKVVNEIAVGRAPTGVVVSPDGRTVFVANTRGHSISFVSAAGARAAAEVQCGYEPMGVCVSPDGKTLYSANFISDDVSVIDVALRREVARIKVVRSPTFMALTPDGKTLLVNNFFSLAPATDTKLTAVVSVIDTASRKVVAEKRSPGTMLMGRGIAVSPDGQYAYVVHHRPNFNITPSQLSQGWVQTHGLAIIPLQSQEEKVVTVLLDNVNSGAANPYGVAVSKDGRRLYVTHRGTHRVSVIDRPWLHGLIKNSKPHVLATTHVNLGFLWGRGELIKRVDSGGLCPNGIAVSPADGSLYVANYFSDAVSVLDPKTHEVSAQIAVGPPIEMTVERRGELLFNDATRCFQHWVSCTSCHPHTRADGVNWDLLNDGMTNPKNAKSLILSAQTPPVMALGVRATWKVAVEKGFLFIQFHQPKQDEIDAVATYIKSAPPIPSPWHRKPDGSPDEQAKRGAKVFVKAGCDMCHPEPLYTDLQMYDVGTGGKRDLSPGKQFDTPTLIEMYRTAPYLHDGGAATLRDVLTTFNKGDEHGTTSNLTKAELNDLIAFLKSL